MVGLIHRVLFQMVAQQGGANAVLEVRNRAGVPPDAVFRMNEPYPDDQFLDLLQAACQVLDVSPMRAEQLFADTFMTFAKKQFPKWFEMCSNSREFLVLQPTLHNSFATGLRDPRARREFKDKFRIETDGDRLVVHYQSPNRLCGLYMSLAPLVIRHYGELATVRELSCMKKGDEECMIVVDWYSKGQNDA